MHKMYFCLSIFYTLEDSAWCYSIQILTIGDFNSFGFFWDTLYRVYQKKVDPFKFKLAITYCGNYAKKKFSTRGTKSLNEIRYFNRLSLI